MAHLMLLCVSHWWQLDLMYEQHSADAVEEKTALHLHLHEEDNSHPKISLHHCNHLTHLLLHQTQGMPFYKITSIVSHSGFDLVLNAVFCMDFI